MTFIALMRKDWRVYRTAVVGGAILVAAPYAVLLTLQWLFPVPDGNTGQTYLDKTFTAANLGMGLTVLMAAVFGGVVFAAERRDRSAEFLALLPVAAGRSRRARPSCPSRASPRCGRRTWPS